jgi:hypothetical protein
LSTTISLSQKEKKPKTTKSTTQFHLLPEAYRTDWKHSSLIFLHRLKLQVIFTARKGLAHLLFPRPVACDTAALTVRHIAIPYDLK